MRINNFSFRFCKAPNCSHGKAVSGSTPFPSKRAETQPGRLYLKCIYHCVCIFLVYRFPNILSLSANSMRCHIGTMVFTYMSLGVSLDTLKQCNIQMPVMYFKGGIVFHSVLSFLYLIRAEMLRKGLLSYSMNE